ncbi:MAG: hypothetical protein ACRDYV_05210, partial [Acidimicrobiia bacterium]
MSSLCRCPGGPLRNTAHPDRRLWCSACLGATPYGRPIPRDQLHKTVRDATSRLAKLEEDLSWDIGTARAGGLGAIGRSGTSDPTGDLVTDPRDAAVRAWRLVAYRRLERALAWLLLADEAAGAMCYAAETRPPDHVQAPYFDTFPTGRPDLEEAHTARANRATRGDGHGF